MRRQTANQTLKRLAKDLASHPFLLFLAFLGTIAQVGLSIYLPILIGQVVDQVMVAGSSPVFWQIFLQMILVVIGNTLVQWVNPLLYNRLIFSYTSHAANSPPHDPLGLAVDATVYGDFTLYCQEILSSLPKANRDKGNSDSVD